MCDETESVRRKFAMNSLCPSKNVDRQKISNGIKNPSQIFDVKKNPLQICDGNKNPSQMSNGKN